MLEIVCLLSHLLAIAGICYFINVLRKWSVLVPDIPKPFCGYNVCYSNFIHNFALFTKIPFNKLQQYQNHISI
jgi:hypothetical protein